MNRKSRYSLKKYQKLLLSSGATKTYGEGVVSTPFGGCVAQRRLAGDQALIVSGGVLHRLF